MRLYGRLIDCDRRRLSFADDLDANLDHADAVSEGIKDSIDAYIAAEASTRPTEPRYQPVWEPDDSARSPTAGQGSARSSGAPASAATTAGSEVPVFDGRGYPTHQRGVTSVPGLYFVGLPWQYTWGSGRFGGVADDARVPRRPASSAPDADRRRAWIAGMPQSETTVA